MITIRQHDMAKYDYTFSSKGMSMDARHINMLYNILINGDFKNVLEIGSFHGASTTAFVEAMKIKSDLNVSICDIVVHPPLRTLLESCQTKERVRFYNTYSKNVINGSYDLIFVDGDHTFNTVKEEVDLLLKHNVETILAHDTNAQIAGYALCEGSHYLGVTLKRLYDWCEDVKDRPNELTKRGFFACSKNPEKYKVILEVFEQLSK
jgi:hypothetical protein